MRRRPRAMAAVLTALITVALVGACTKPTQEAASSTCESAVEQASEALEVAQQVSLLDDALLSCTSVAELQATLGRYPGIIGYDVATFVDVRCHRIADEAIRTAPVCATVVAPATTAPSAPTEVVFIGETLDGRKIRIVADADTQFVGDVPAVIQQTVDIAIESGCTGVYAQRDQWAAKIEDPVIGDEASVYTQHAQNVAAYIGCEPQPIPTTTVAG